MIALKLGLATVKLMEMGTDCLQIGAKYYLKTMIPIELFL
jgi:hypothetical protein